MDPDPPLDTRDGQRGTERMPARAVRRPELLARLAALADDTSLRILEVLAAHGELPAQEIIARAGITQSSASRHLSQLRGAGYLRERRGVGASKHYCLVPGQVAGTFQALEQLLSGRRQEAEQEATDQQQLPSEFREIARFVNSDGYLVRWPSKERDRALVLRYLITFFAAGREYSEREVNDLLRPHSGRDHANLRRMLYDHGLLGRAPDGSRYWVERSSSES